MIFVLDCKLLVAVGADQFAHRPKKRSNFAPTGNRLATILAVFEGVFISLRCALR